MRIEQKLTDALREEAEGREVDVDALWHRTRYRLHEQEPSRRRPGPVLAAAAAAVALVVGGLAVAEHVRPDDQAPAAPGDDKPIEGGVDDSFSCPEQITHDWTRPETVTDEHFVASLRGGPAQQARVYDAPRYEFEEAGDRAFLRFGNADGSLATLSEFRRVDGEWTRHRTEVCVGKDGSVAVPTRHPLDLGNFADVPYDPTGVAPRRASLVDARFYYDTVGLKRVRSIWANACGPNMCLSSGDEGGLRSTITIKSGEVPTDASALFLPFDNIPERHNPYGLWVVYNGESRVSSILAYDRDGQVVGTTSGKYVDGWGGDLKFIVAPFDEVARIEVTRIRSSARPNEQGTLTFTPDELPGYRADLHR
jgi:hypothetical protein